MKKALEGWYVRHLLMVSVALNVCLVLKLAYYDKESNFTTEQIFHGFCAEEKLHNHKQQQQLSLTTSSSSSSVAAVVAEKAFNFFNPSTSSSSTIVNDVVVDDGRVINLDQ